MESQVRVLSGLNILIGLWLIIAPFTLSYAVTGNIWQEVVFGVLVIVFGLVKLATPSQAWPSWINAIIGIWILIAPWIISGTSAAAKWNETIVGIVIALLAYASGASSELREPERRT